MTKKPPAVLTLVVGAESLLCERAVERVFAQARALDAGTEKREIVAGEPGAAGAVVEACSPTLFGGGAVVMISGVESAGDACLDAIELATADPASGVAIVALHAGGARGKKILDRLAVLADSRVDCGEIKKGRAVNDFLAAELRSHRRSMTPEAQAILLSAVGTDVRAIAAACGQLVADIEEPEISIAAISRYFDGTVEVTGFQIADAVMNRQAAAALRLLRLAEGTDGGRLGPVIVSALSNAVRQVAAVTGAAPGMSDRDLAIAAKVPPWKLKSLASQGRRWRPMDLAKAMLVISDLDASMKGGLRLGEQLDPVQKGLLLERAVVGLASRGGSQS